MKCAAHGVLTDLDVTEMLLPQQQSLLTELIQNTVVRVCVEHVPFEGRLELDGLVCINSDLGGARQIVVKIHTVVGRKDAFAERMAAQKTSWQATPSAVNKNGLSQNTPDAMPLDARLMSQEDALSAEAVEDTDYKSGESVDEHLPPWSRHAPQILKLLTKSDAASDKTVHPPPTDLSVASSAKAEKSPDAPIKREPVAVNEVAQNATKAEAHVDHHTAKWRCKMCQLLCANFGELESHMRNVHVRFVCRLCLNSFTLSCNLRRHMKLHAGVRPHTCLFCSASFSRSTDLKIHMKKHPLAASVDCNHESPGSPQQEPLSLKKPAILHECDLCSKGFAAAAHLADHRLTHDSPTAGENERNVPDSEQVNGKAGSSREDHVTNGGALKNECSSRNVAAGIDLAETVREFAPLFHLGEAGVYTPGSDKASVFLATIAQHTSAAKSATQGRNKRKGLPMKRIDVGNDDYEMTADDGETVVKKALLEDDTSLVKNENMSDVSADVDVTPAMTSQMNKEQAEVGLAEKSELSEGPSISPQVTEVSAGEKSEAFASPAVVLQASDEQVDVVSGDLDSKVFNCQYAGGCSAICHGFVAYERHYMSAHGGRYPCSLCPQSFTSRNNRRRHTDGHVGAAGHGRHQCLTCGKRFARADIIKEHRLTHTRSYQLGTCGKCGESCGTKKSSLLLHLKRCLTATDVDADIIDDAKVTEPGSSE